MAITWTERPGTAKIEKGKATLSYTLTGVNDRILAYALAKGYSAVLFGNLFRSSVQVSEAGPLLFFCDVTYGTEPNREPTLGEFKWTFDTTGKTKHVTQAISNVQRYTPPGEPVVGEAGIIGEQDDGTVEGVDIPDRAFRWTETHQLLLADYGFAHATVLGDYTSQTNSGAFRGFPAYTVLFGGASGAQSSKDPDLLEITYNFEVSPSESGLTVGEIAGIAKTGWDYLWVRYETNTDITAKKTVQRARQASVERVYRSFDFSILGIGS